MQAMLTHSLPLCPPSGIFQLSAGYEQNEPINVKLRVDTV